jgi:hypothetical protein
MFFGKLLEAFVTLFELDVDSSCPLAFSVSVVPFKKLARMCGCSKARTSFVVAICCSCCFRRVCVRVLSCFWLDLV